MLSFTGNAGFAGPFVHAPIRGDTETVKKPEPPKPDPKKILEAAPLTLAVKHCIALEGIITEQFRLVDAFNYQPDLENLPGNMEPAQKEKTMLYVMGRPDVPDFGFLIPETWKTARRDLRIRFNSISTLQLASALGFKYGGYPFHGNCKGKLDADIATDKNGNEKVNISMPLAFDTSEVTLTYVLYRQRGYNWQIDDLLVNNIGASNLISKDLGRNATEKGLEQTIIDICAKSPFPSLKCIIEKKVEPTAPKL